MDKLSKAINYIKRWCVEVSDTDKILISNFLNSDGRTELSPLLLHYVKFLSPYINLIKNNKGEPRETDCFVSGIVFFYGCLFYIMHFPEWNKFIDSILSYDILYILVDHYIDDQYIDKQKKNNTIKAMYMLLEDPDAEIAPDDILLKTIAGLYRKLINFNPQIKQSIYDIFKSEIDGLTIQSNGQLTRSQYYNIAIEKGGNTMKLLADIVNIPELHDASYHLGTIMQLIDDSIDVLSDMENGIHTIATFDYITKGNLDDIWIDIVDRISTINTKFTLFKIIYSWFAVYIPGKIPNMFSDSLRIHVNKYNIFLGYDGCQLIMDAINYELIS